MKKIEAIIRPEKLDEVKQALADKGYIGLNIVGVTGRGVQKGIVHAGRTGQPYSVDMLPKVKLETVVADASADEVVQIIQQSAWTGNIWPTIDTCTAGSLPTVSVDINVALDPVNYPNERYELTDRIASMNADPC